MFHVVQYCRVLAVTCSPDVTVDHRPQSNLNTAHVYPTTSSTNITVTCSPYLIQCLLFASVLFWDVVIIYQEI